MERPKTELELVGERCAEVVRTWAPKNPDGNRDGLLLIADFCWALGVTPHVTMAPRQEMADEMPPTTADAP